MMRYCVKLDELEEYIGNAETDLYDRITQTVYVADRKLRHMCISLRIKRC